MAKDFLQRVLVIGGLGAIGQSLLLEFNSLNVETIAPSHDELDITNSRQTNSYIEHIKPSLVINAAAFTDVEKSEQEQLKAWTVNAYGSLVVANGCTEQDIPLVHFSTDFVFSGEKQEPYSEEDRFKPLSVYGDTKAAGDLFIRHVTDKYFIIRISRLFGIGRSGRKDFVRRVLEAAVNQQHLEIVNDQVACYTYSKDLAGWIVALLMKDAPYGVYNLCNGGECSWYTFTKKILEIIGYQFDSIMPVSSTEWPSLATRPAYSSLSTKKFQQLTGILPRDWEYALLEYLTDLPGREPFKC